MDELLHCQDTVSALNKNVSEESSKSDQTEKKMKDSRDDQSPGATRDRSDSCEKYNQDSAINRTVKKSSEVRKECNTQKVIKSSLRNLSNDREVRDQRSTESQDQEDVQSCKGNLIENVSLCVRKTQTMAPSSTYADGDGNHQKNKTVDASASSMTDSLEKEKRTKLESKDTASSESQSKEPAGLPKEAEERMRLQNILRSRLQFVLLNLIKLHSGTKKG